MDFTKRLTVVPILVLLLAGVMPAQSPAKKKDSPSKAAAKGPAAAHAKGAAVHKTAAAHSAPPIKAAAASKGSGKSAARPSAAKGATGTTAGKSKSGVRSKTPPVKAPPRSYAQMQPTPDRYKEIQQALADKGYFHGTADGAWGADSQDALKRFQADQNLDTDGKLSALSLLALGLGPHREAARKPGEDAAPAPLGGAPETPQTPEAPPGTGAR